jgi:dihydrofolate reductase
MRVSVFVGVTIDGFIAREDGSFDFLKPFEADDNGYFDFIRTVEVLVIGRETYETVLGFDEWPYGGKRVIVLTHRPLSARHGETAYQGAQAPLMARLAEERVQHVYLDGGIAIRQGLDEDLVDDMTISTVPVTIGRGRPLFGGRPGTQRRARVALREYPSGMVQARYERQR